MKGSNFMNVDDAILSRFSCREFSSEALSDSQIIEILNAARHAPSPKNRQPWRFSIIRNEDKREFVKIFERSGDVFCHADKLNEFNSENQTYKILNEADTVILVFNLYYSRTILGKDDLLFDVTNIQAIGAAIENMLLKATSMGIGSLWICDVFSHNQQICSQYCPDGQLIAAIALGYPKKSISKSFRKPLKDLIITKQEDNYG